MSNLLKYVSNIFLRPLVSRYLSQERVYAYEGIKLQIPPQVFHPAFFFSTKLLIKYMSGMDIKGKRLLELGAGSGLISFCAAKQGAIVTATDINPVAVAYLQKNSEHNKLPLNIYLSDLFHDIPLQQFHLMLINPPYFKKDPVSDYDYAWYCGKNGAYFSKLFTALGSFVLPDSLVIMILSNECDLEMIRGFAANSGWDMQLQLTKKKYWETNLIYHIVPLTQAIAL